MPRINLKNILKSSEITALLSSLTENLHASIFIEDDTGKILFGTAAGLPANSEQLKSDEEIIGWVKGDAHIGIVASLINILIQKEAERKKLGSEVLMLYQEV